VNGSMITLDNHVYLNDSLSSIITVIYRVYGGRGSITSSHVTCTADSSLCPPARRLISGSMEGKFESITELTTNGVQVERAGPDTTNGFIWRVTFLGDSYSGALNWAVTIF